MAFLREWPCSMRRGCQILPMNVMTRLPLLLLCFIFTGLVVAQDDATHHRAVYKEINDNLKSYKEIKATYTDAELTWTLTAWKDGEHIRRIDAKVPGEDGDGEEEYYLEDGKMLFAFRYYMAMSAEADAKPVTVEDRFYFNDGTMFKWIGTDKKLIPKEDEAFTIEAERLTTNLASFLVALGEGKAAMGKVTALKGTFKGIEQGDYGHWNMVDEQGKEHSFFIMQPDESIDKVLEKPEAYVGKACVVQWKKSMENIPEAGGEMAIEQVLSVEWPGK
jgi:hypothetical protein